MVFMLSYHHQLDYADVTSPKKGLNSF